MTIHEILEKNFTSWEYPVVIVTAKERGTTDWSKSDLTCLEFLKYPHHKNPSNDVKEALLIKLVNIFSDYKVTEYKDKRKRNWRFDFIPKY